MNFAIDVREKGGLRTLRFESECVQGAMRVLHPWCLELEYTRVMMAGLLLRDPSSYPRNVLLIGLGAGSLTKFLYRHFPLSVLTVVEIDGRVVEVASEHFGLPDDTARLNIVIGDGAEYMANTEPSYDLILVDGFNEHSHPGDLNTLPFYQACRVRLSDRGLLAVNLIGLCDGVKGGFAHIETAFDNRAVMFPRCKSGNTIVFAATGEPVNIELDQLSHRARALEERTGLALLPTIARLDKALCCVDGRLRI
ncbi:MAG: fused MFS/spermidine synthase [Nitrosomonadales bacterium]|nr:fused MFS/spermidine synthase [Nitrosomonadales bacterium]